MLGHLSQCLREVSFMFLYHSNMLSVSRAPVTETFPCILWPTFHTLGVVRGFSRGCFRVLYRDGARDFRSTPFLNIHWYGDHP